MKDPKDLAHKAILRWLATLDTAEEYYKNVVAGVSSLDELQSIATKVIKLSGNLQLKDLNYIIEQTILEAITTSSTCKCQ